MKQNEKASDNDTPGKVGNMVDGKEIKLTLQKSESWLFPVSSQEYFEIHVTIISTQLYRLLSNKENIN